MGALVLDLKWEGRKVRMAGTQEAPQFVVADVCEVLGLVDPAVAVRALDEDEKGRCNVPTPGGPQEVLTVTEPGLYALLARSRKPEARKFDRWVRHEVLPTIRKHGCYPAPSLAILGGNHALVKIDHAARLAIKEVVVEAIDESDLARKQDLHDTEERLRIDISRVGGRRELTDSTKVRHRLAVAQAPYHGRCPVCRTTRIVDPVTRQPTPACRFDHFYSNKKNSFDHTWPICAGCHDGLDGEPDNGLNDLRLSSRGKFECYQENARVWADSPGNQLELPGARHA